MLQTKNVDPVSGNLSKYNVNYSGRRRTVVLGIKAEFNKSVLSPVPWLTTWHCMYPLQRGCCWQPAMQQSIHISWAHSSKPAVAACGKLMGQTDGQWDGRTANGCTDLHSTWAVPINSRTESIATKTVFAKVSVTCLEWQQHCLV